jgi:AraC family transcriptional regulator, regulatory protein of adaptative response / methylated-DNA-[protein]-cysteine methyltransferase
LSQGREKLNLIARVEKPVLAVSSRSSFISKDEKMSNVIPTPKPELEIGDDLRWAALVARDKSANDSFYAVKTTGVYCKPSCPARLPKRENVAFYFSIEQAEDAGFRACKRCKPTQSSSESDAARKIVAACRIIEASEEIPSLTELAQEVGLSQHHFHRVFKSTTGLTPRGYAVAHRANRVRDQLAEKETVTNAIYGAGFGSSSRFYAKAEAMLGMKPSEFRSGASGKEMHFAVGECRLGSILVAASAKGVCAILLGDDPDELVRDLQDRFPRAILVGDVKEFEATVAAVVSFVEAPQSAFNLPLDIQGTSFQQRVWQALRAIPAGRTATYADIATAIGSPKAVRAVAQACGANSLAVAIPCHRVIRTDGSLSGYRWGVERKRQLLQSEAA